jgi:hypothetical protein
MFAVVAGLAQPASDIEPSTITNSGSFIKRTQSRGVATACYPNENSTNPFPDLHPGHAGDLRGQDAERAARYCCRRNFRRRRPAEIAGRSPGRFGKRPDARRFPDDTRRAPQPDRELQAFGTAESNLCELRGRKCANGTPSPFPVRNASRVRAAAKSRRCWTLRFAPSLP